MSYEESTKAEAFDRSIRRLDACTYTAGVVQRDLTDPTSIDRRADLLIAAENLAAQAFSLLNDIRELAWQDSTFPISNTM
jgi:hypothetical protein